ncbi:hypothetical protein Taro_051576, partial [Colocasia esculenta]|nr:hypothetical protein [Colocasia esculenta]
FEIFDSLWFSFCRLTSDGVNRIKSIVQKNFLLEKSYSLLPICIWNHWQLVVMCNKGENDMSFLMLLDSLHMGEPTRIENELKNFLKIAYEGKKMRAVADELKVIDLHVPKLTADWFSREEYEKFREDLQGKRIHIDARSASTSKRKFDIPISLCDFVMKDLDQKWRSWKYDLRTKFFTPYQNAQQHFACSDTRVVEDQWKNLDKIRDIKLTQQSNTSSSIASVGDAYEQVMGRDRTGRVCGIGTGPTPKSLWGSRSEQKLCQDNESLKEKIDALKEKMKKFESRVLQVFVMLKGKRKGLISLHRNFARLYGRDLRHLFAFHSVDWTEVAK